MIPADHIRFNDDGTAWLVTHGGLGVDLFDSLDRPCDTCDGKSANGTDDERDLWAHDCIDGRHTFEIQVQTGESWPPVIVFPRVSIVPGMVLPIARELDHSRDMIVDKVAHVWISDRGQAMWWTPDRDDEDPIWNYITLPPAAKAGMWAVQLKVES